MKLTWCHAASRSLLDAARNVLEEETRGRVTLKYGPFESTHSARGVIDEEVEELHLAVHANDLVAIRKEAVHVAAMALRLVAQCAMTCQDPKEKADADGAGAVS